MRLLIAMFGITLLDVTLGPVEPPAAELDYPQLSPMLRMIPQPCDDPTCCPPEAPRPAGPAIGEQIKSGPRVRGFSAPAEPTEGADQE